MITIDETFVGQKVWHFTYGELTIRSWSDTKKTIEGIAYDGRVRWFTPENCELWALHQAQEIQRTQVQQEREAQERQRQQEQEEQLILKQRSVQERKHAREQSKVIECYDDLLRQGYPEFTKHEKYETAVFSLTEENREAYVAFRAYVMSYLGELAQAEADTPVFGRIGFDIWADESTKNEAATWLRSLGVIDAERRIKIGRGSHGIKVNLCLPNNPQLAGLDHQLQTNMLHARRLATGQSDLRTIQIGKRSLCEYLIRDGVLPEEIQ